MPCARRRGAHPHRHRRQKQGVINPATVGVVSALEMGGIAVPVTPTPARELRVVVSDIDSAGPLTSSVLGILSPRPQRPHRQLAHVPRRHRARTLMAGGAGALLGCAVGWGVGTLLTTAAPAQFAAGVGLLATGTALVAALVPPIFASRRDPATIMRTP